MSNSKWDEVVGLTSEARLNLDLAISHLETVLTELNDTITKLEHSVKLNGESDWMDII